MKLKKITITGLLIASTFASCASAASTAFDQQIWAAMDGKSNLSFNRVTRGGEFSGCELVFEYPYQDSRALKGKPIYLVGGISSLYFKGKNLGFMLKVRANEMMPSNSPNGMTAKAITPAVAGMHVNGNSMAGSVKKSQECEQKGQCVVYFPGPSPDQFSTFMDMVFSQQAFDAEVFWSLTKGGMDNKFKLSELKVEKGTNQELRKQYTQCLWEITSLIKKDLEEHAQSQKTRSAK